MSDLSILFTKKDKWLKTSLLDFGIVGDHLLVLEEERKEKNFIIKLEYLKI